MNTQDHTLLELKVIDQEIKIDALHDRIDRQDKTIVDLERQVDFLKKAKSCQS